MHDAYRCKVIFLRDKYIFMCIKKFIDNYVFKRKHLLLSLRDTLFIYSHFEVSKYFRPLNFSFTRLSQKQIYRCTRWSTAELISARIIQRGIFWYYWHLSRLWLPSFSPSLSDFDQMRTQIRRRKERARKNNLFTTWQ